MRHIYTVKPPSHRRATSVRPFSDKFWPHRSDIAEIRKKNMFLCDCSGDPWALSRRPEMEISANFMAISSIPWPTYASSQQPCCTPCTVNSYLRRELRDHSTMLRWPRWPPSTLWAPLGWQWRLLRDPSWTRSMIYIKRWFCCSSINLIYLLKEKTSQEGQDSTMNNECLLHAALLQFHLRSFVTSERPLGYLGAAWETLERQSSALSATWFLNAHAATILNLFKNWWRPRRPWQPQNALRRTKTTSERPSGGQWRPRKISGRSRVVQGSPFLCDGGFNCINWYLFEVWHFLHIVVYIPTMINPLIPALYFISLP